MNFLYKRARKNTDSIKSAQFFVVFLWFFLGPIMLAWVTASFFPFFTWLIKGGIIILLFLALVLTALFLFFMSKTSDSILTLLGQGGRSIRNLREQLSGELTVIREDKKNGSYESALQRVNTYLEQDPEYAEALYLKAQILWEGFQKGDEAREYLLRIIKSTPKEGPINRWARKTYAEIRNAEAS